MVHVSMYQLAWHYLSYLIYADVLIYLARSILGANRMEKADWGIWIEVEVEVPDPAFPEPVESERGVWYAETLPVLPNY